MIDPNDYLTVQLRIGSHECQVLNMHNKVVLGSRAQSDKAAMKQLASLVDELLADRKRNQTSSS